MAAAPAAQNEPQRRRAADLLEQRSASRDEAAQAANRGAMAGASASAGGSASDLDYRRLEDARAIRLEDWRALRERWRAFASAHPGSPHADEARVQVVACGLEALRAGRDDADLAAMERDAAAYLARPDAQQRPRVRSLLEAAASR